MALHAWQLVEHLGVLWHPSHCSRVAGPHTSRTASQKAPHRPPPRPAPACPATSDLAAPSLRSPHSRDRRSTAINSFCPSARAPMSTEAGPRDRACLARRGCNVHSRSSESRTLKCTPSAPHVHVIALQAALAKKLPVPLLPDRHPRLLLVDPPLVDPRCRTSRVPASQVMPRARPVPSGPPAAGFGVACLGVPLQVGSDFLLERTHEHPPRALPRELVQRASLFLPSVVVTINNATPPNSLLFRYA
jgi:hypothetical protein